MIDSWFMVALIVVPFVITGAILVYTLHIWFGIIEGKIKIK